MGIMGTVKKQRLRFMVFMGIMGKMKIAINRAYDKYMKILIKMTIKKANDLWVKISQIPINRTHDNPLKIKGLIYGNYGLSKEREKKIPINRFFSLSSPLDSIPKNTIKGQIKP